MYLKNTSDKFQIGMRTKKEVLTINPGDAVHVFDSDIISINSNLVQITESEYDKLKEANKPNKKEDKVKEQNEHKKEDNQENKEIKEVDSTTEHSLMDNTISEPKTEEKVDNKMEVNEQSENGELQALEQTLVELKEKWEQADKPGKKAQIQKRIKRVQEQINGLK